MDRLRISPHSAFGAGGNNNYCSMEDNSVLNSVQSLSLFDRPLIDSWPFDDLMDRFWYDREFWGYPEAKFPRVQHEIKDDKLIYQFALAGYSPDQIKAEVKDGTLTISSTKKEGKRSLFAARAFTWKKRDAYGEWDLEKTSLEMGDGLLTVSIPRKPAAEGKRLEIRVSD
jgi:HSP20 family protein